jgi:hypothetical protein
MHLMIAPLRALRDFPDQKFQKKISKKISKIFSKKIQITHHAFISVEECPQI